ncbi:hypothetical protein CTAYLR_002781 [Chrysophaeum taylorii]|uniref:Ankyrin n=1 Tax=Chrysophaeum taylorii TaxID=2483200 RepID=A0AAD7UCP2_9STRA|nr:hypothetical protein CTAYLR_002781 [Chrysophaeum taylorii]
MGIASRTISREGLDVDTVLTPDGETGVCIRFQGDREDPYYEPVLRCLLRHGASPNVKTMRGATPAHCAASYNLTSVLSLLHEFGADVDVEDREGYAPAHICAGWGKTEALEWLLTKGGVGVEREHTNGMSLAMFAATAGHLDTLKCLKTLGANLRKPCRIEHELIRGQRVMASVMAMALYEGRNDIADWLVAECDIGKHESEIVVCYSPEDEEAALERERLLFDAPDESTYSSFGFADDEEGTPETKGKWPEPPRSPRVAAAWRDLDENDVVADWREDNFPEKMPPPPPPPRHDSDEPPHHDYPSPGGGLVDREDASEDEDSAAERGASPPRRYVPRVDDTISDDKPDAASKPPDLSLPRRMHQVFSRVDYVGRDDLHGMADTAQVREPDASLLSATHPALSRVDYVARDDDLDSLDDVVDDDDDDEPADDSSAANTTDVPCPPPPSSPVGDAVVLPDGEATPMVEAPAPAVPPDQDDTIT